MRSHSVLGSPASSDRTLHMSYPYQRAIPAARSTRRTATNRDYALSSTTVCSQRSVLLVLDDGFCLLAPSPDGNGDELSACIWQKPAANTVDSTQQPVRSLGPDVITNVGYEAEDWDNSSIMTPLPAHVEPQDISPGTKHCKDLAITGSLHKLRAWQGAGCRGGQAPFCSNGSYLGNCDLGRCLRQPPLQQDISSHTSSELSFSLAKVTVRSPPSPVWKAGDYGCTLVSKSIGQLNDHESNFYDPTHQSYIEEKEVADEEEGEQIAQGTHVSTPKATAAAASSRRGKSPLQPATPDCGSTSPQDPTRNLQPSDKTLQKWDGINLDQPQLVNLRDHSSDAIARVEGRTTCCSVNYSNSPASVQLNCGAIGPLSPGSTNAKSVAKPSVWHDNLELSESSRVSTGPKISQQKTSKLWDCPNCNRVNGFYQGDKASSCSGQTLGCGDDSLSDNYHPVKPLTWMKTKRNCSNCNFSAFSHTRSRVPRSRYEKENEDPQPQVATIEQYGCRRTHETKAQKPEHYCHMAGRKECFLAYDNCEESMGHKRPDNLIGQENRLREGNHHHIHQQHHHHCHHHPHQQQLCARCCINRKRECSSTHTKTLSRQVCRLCDHCMASTHL